MSQPQISFSLAAMSGKYVCLIFEPELNQSKLNEVADIIRHAFEVDVVGIDHQNRVVFYKHGHHIGNLVAKIVFHGIMQDLPLTKISWDDQSYDGKP